VWGGKESAVSIVVLVHGHKRALDRGRFPLLETLALGLRRTWREVMRAYMRCNSINLLVQA
jgi:hypothetical protein